MLSMDAAIFDMDGTLADSLIVLDILYDSIREAYPQQQELCITEQDNNAIRVLPLRDSMQLLHDHYGVAESGEELFAFETQVFRDFYTNRVELKPGVAPFLAHLKEQGVRMCVASATAPDLVEAALAHCGIRHYFDAEFSCGVLGKGKDAPDIYEMTRDFLGASTELTWVFEDALVAVRTATGLGMPTVGIYDRYNPNQEEIRRMATHYIGPGETLMKLIEERKAE